MSGIEAPKHVKQEKFVEIPISEHGSTSLINQNQNQNQSRTKWWISVFLCIALVVIGQSCARLLENFYYDETKRSDYDEKKQYDGTWTQALLQNVAFPLLIVPFILFPSKKSSPPPISCDKSSFWSLAIIYPSLGIILISHSRLYALAKLYINYGFFTILFAAQLIFMPVLTRIINKTKFSRWMIISIILAIASGALTQTTAFGGEPDEAEENYGKGIWCALFAGICFSLLLCNIQLTFDQVIVKRNISTNRKIGFPVVFELLIFVSFVACLISLVGLFVSGEHNELKSEMDTFNRGKGAYVMVLVGQALGWQVYWVGIVGLVFRVSCVFANVVTVCVWPIVSVLIVLVFNFMDDEFDAFKGGALAAAALSIAAYVYWLSKEKPSDTETRQG